MTARARLALSYALFLVAAGVAVLLGVYVVLRYVPDYPLTTSDPSVQGDPVASRTEILQALLRMSGGVLLFLAVVGTVGGWFLAGWVLRPLHHLNDAARAAAEGRLDHRIRMRGRNDEFRQLADSFDHMLERLDDTFAAQERFAANASHELRTPLAVTGAILDAARLDPEGRDVPEVLERLRATNARAIGLTESLLRLADVQAVHTVSTPLDLAREVRASVDEHAEEALRRGLRLEHRLAPAPVRGDAALLAGVADNLVDNALRHNADAGHVLVTTGYDPATGAVFLRVANPGRVYGAAEADRLREPFHRAGRTRDGDGARGYGLGLALVDRVAQVHQGRLEIVPRAGGGLVVTVHLPASPEVWRAPAVHDTRAQSS
ncbi:HAMP domain-containing sensor histidine kinase [Nocardiopsis sp. MG754419]|uniref:HAMP domain-containing sensor histidine kinase n=1 Tax=Nocardiopsis sp. MG754419 TaxID=2259865 RepID=UPI0027DE97F5|nr:HAMP domain-containing sensor histidine kinase [Nocardiopsis sp. MG754419]